MPVWFENEAPSTISRSASFMNQLATGVPLRPSTPQASGWSSAICPLALNVVITGAPSPLGQSDHLIAVKAGPVADDDDRALGGLRAGRSPARCDAAGGLISSGVSRPSGPRRVAVAGGKGLHLVGEDQVRGALLEDRVLAGERHQLGVLGGLEHRLGPAGDLAERG